MTKPGMSPMRIVLFGSGSSIIVDVEETCARLDVDVAAVVKNVKDEDRTWSAAREIPIEQVGDELKALGFVVPIFTPAHRRRARDDAYRIGFGTAATLVDPTSSVARSATLEAGVYVNAGVVIGGAAALGGFVFVNRSASIGHHAQIAEFASIGPGAVLAGCVRLGRGAAVCAGAVVLPEVTIGANSVVGAGAVVRESVPDHCLAVGNPARVVRTGYPGYRNMAV